MLIIYFLLGLTFAIDKNDIKVGDILLQPLHCWSCSLIEAQTESEYSHIGVVISDKPLRIAEAFMSVREISFDEFNKKTQKNLRLKVMRPHWVNPDISKVFREEFLGLSYDNKFLWGNYNEKGEMIYCSELLYKLFLRLNMIGPRPRAMSYDVNREYWERFFRGPAPDGKLGISPAQYDDESFYFNLGNL